MDTDLMVANRKHIPPATWNAIGLLVAVVVIGALVLWLLPAVLTRHPSASMTAAERLRAANDVRAPLVAFLVAVGAAGTLWFTGRSYLLNREGQITDRYTKAVGQLGDESSPVRIGGIYALERIANDSDKDRTTILYVLGAFIRECSREERKRPDDPQEEVTTALRVATRLLRISDPELLLDLRDAYLRNADLSGLRKSQVLTDGANLVGARLPRDA